MIIDLMVERVWSTARPILLNWSDQASEIFVIDLPLSGLDGVLQRLRQQLYHPQLLRLDGQQLHHPRPFDFLAEQEMLQRSWQQTVHCVKGQLDAGAGPCYFYLWVRPEQGELELEMVFWNDVCFPPGEPLQRHKQMLGRLLRFAHRVRGGHRQSRCILSREYNAEPHALLDSATVAVW